MINLQCKYSYICKEIEEEKVVGKDAGYTVGLSPQKRSDAAYSHSLT